MLDHGALLRRYGDERACSSCCAIFLLAACLLLASSGLSTARGQELPETVVTATRIPTPLNRIGSAVSVITREDLEHRQTRLVSDVLEDVPGVSVRRTGPPGAQTQVRIRGAEANQSLVLIDGVRANDPAGGDDFDFGQLRAVDIERIEVLRGPQSALWGSDAIGGVINIITRKAEQKAQASLSGEGGSFSSYQFTGNLGSRGERYHVLVGGTLARSDGINAAAFDGAERDGFDNNTLTFNAGATPRDNLELSVVGRYIDSQRDFDDFAFNPAIGVLTVTDADNTSEAQEGYGRAETKLTLWDGRWEHILGGYIANKERTVNEEDGGVSTFDGRNTEVNYQSNLFLDTPRVASAEHQLSLFVNHRIEEATIKSAFQDFDQSIDLTGLAGEYRVGLWEQLFFTGGARHERNEFFEDSTSYRLTAAYLHRDTATRLHGSFGTAVKNPTLTELFGRFSLGGFRGNPNLQPEESEGWDIGIEQTLWEGRVSGDVTYFHTNITDLITGAGNTAINLAGRTRIEGIELSAEVQLVSDLDLVASYTYTDSQDPDGDPLVRRPEHQGSLHLNYRFYGGRANANIGARFFGDQTDFVFDQSFDRSRVQLDGYTLVNVTGSYQVAEFLELFGRIENLLDEDYQEAFSFATPGIAGYAGIKAVY